MYTTALRGRDYQVAALDHVFGEWLRDVPSTLAVMPTGTGKTVLAAMVASRAWNEYGRRTLFIAERRKLIRQARKTLTRAGLKVAVEMGMESARESAAADGMAQVVVATPQTLAGERMRGWDKNSFGVVISDEAHHARAPMYRRIYDHFENYWHLGITATPGRGDGKNLGAVFRSVAYRLRFHDAVDMGVIVPLDPHVIPVQVDLRKIRMTKGDLNVGDLAERIGPQVEELCDAVCREVGDRYTVVFTPDVASAAAVAQVLTDRGLPAKYVAGQAGKFGMKRKECDQVLEAFDRCEFQVLVCCELLIEGYDCAHVEAVAVMRPTRNRFRYTQMVGRGTRPCPEVGKKDCLVLDFDWVCDDSCRDIVSPVELFDDGLEAIPPSTMDEAKKRLREGRCANFMEAIAEAEDAVRMRPRLDIKLTGVVAKYAKYRRDPRGVGKLLGLTIKPYDMDPKGSNPPTKNQLGYLKVLGVHHPEGVSKWGAAKLIKELSLRQRLSLADVGQVQALLTHGAPEDRARAMKSSDAAEVLRASWAQGSLF